MAHLHKAELFTDGQVKLTLVVPFENRVQALHLSDAYGLSLRVKVERL